MDKIKRVSISTARLIEILLGWDKIKEAKDVRPFIDRIMADGDPEPDRRYTCDVCLQKTDGDDGRFYGTNQSPYGDERVFICKWCREREAANETKEGL